MVEQAIAVADYSLQALSQGRVAGDLFDPAKCFLEQCNAASTLASAL